MRGRAWLIWLILSAVAGGASMATSRPTEPSPQPSPGVPGEGAGGVPGGVAGGVVAGQGARGVAGPLRDPTEADVRLRQALDARRPGAASTTRPAAKGLQIVRRGFLQVVGQVPEGLIEVQGTGIFLVRDGDTVKVAMGPNEAAVVLRVRKVAPDGIEIEYGSDTLIIR